MNKLEKARNYVKENKDKINKKYRMTYHVMAPVGWINDPNGFSYYKGEYHLFYQYHPYSSEWGPMHWGHVKSKDLIKWEDLPVAIAPDMPYDADGCFSGSAIEHDEKLYLIYTGHIDKTKKPEDIRQIQNIAVSEDGINFTKIKENPVIGTDTLPQEAKSQDFRDPKVWKKGDLFYVVVGSRNVDGSGQILMYKSKDLINWEFVNIIAKSSNKIGKMWECPDFFEIDGKDVLIISPQYLESKGDRFNNIYSSIYMIGSLNYEKGIFVHEDYYEIDHGFDFYAPQTLIDDKGRRIMIAWMNVWDRKWPTHELKHGWNGAMTLPRVIQLKGNKITFSPVEEIKKYRNNEYRAVETITNISKRLPFDGFALEIEALIDITHADRAGFKLCKGDKEETILYFNKRENKVTLDRNNSGIGPGRVRKTTPNVIENKIKFRIFVDRSSIEVFINDGEQTMTALIYPSDESNYYEIFADGTAQFLITKWDIKL
ncbi:sucrose-6-phosphate hydrolase [Caloranaerobacter sp. TR13]|uniref:glycoside hydrolase family 32 protein n=1 Tax=Caloranaerobacter sp. TR13 TaxID=1302151 RepID=UPI0006D462DE|nr:sucrose-6-phosphate hydrolase [Caloranaerobacter sp. TR13]KPU27683.1 sucrose-6-phosphate hydrolase [Caloranaerobacter sp. TR13]